MNAFNAVLSSHGLTLKRAACATLQVNVGYLCNMGCRHCHLDAGPGRGSEVMSRETAEAVVALAERCRFDVADITGGAPELMEVTPLLADELAKRCPKVILRCNLTALAGGGRDGLIKLLADRRVAIVASLPSPNRAQTDAQRGPGAFDASLGALKMLNSHGYGVAGSGLDLDIAANACGAFLPPSQIEAEAKFRRDLERLGKISFTGLLTFANAPLGRFRSWLADSGNLAPYSEKLRESFNPCTVGGLMCRSLLSVSWDGCAYDCDFNQAAGLPLGGRRVHVSELHGAPGEGEPIATGDHCFACTAGAGFTCGGSIAA